MNRDDEESLGFFAEFAVSRVRFFPLTELALSITRSFALLRMTWREGLRMIKECY
jgi:hypothetical protein